MRFPNLFLVGAPKSGTTSLFWHLAGHADVFAPPVKELNHFGEDLQYRNRRSIEAYAAAFAGWTDERYAPDGSVFHLLSRTAATEIATASPEARIIVMLREPLDALRSLHVQLLQSGDEDERDLGRALELAPRRAAGAHIPALADHPHALQYLDVLDYEPQVRRYLDTFGADRVHVELFDDLKADAGSLYRRCLTFLELDDDGRTSMEHLNAALRVRSTTVRDLVREPPVAIKRLSRLVLPGPTARKVVRRAARGSVKAANRVPTTAAPLDSDVRDLLVSILEPRLDGLEALLDRDLSAWRHR